jgi:YidC/Oxa1 family membrane protein insertase
MDNQRLFLWTGLALVLFLNYQAWQHDYAPPPATPSAESASLPKGAAPAGGSTLSDALPSLGTPPAGGAAPVAAGTDAAVGQAAPAAAPTVHVRTDVLELVISTQGGEIREATLLKYPREKDTPNELVTLLTTDGPEAPSVFQWGLTAGGTGAEPNHKAVFSAAQSAYTLADGATELAVPLTWSDGAGVTVTRTLRLKRGSYAIELDQHVANEGSTPWRGRAYSQILRHWQKSERSMWNPATSSFRGPSMYNGKKYQKLDLEKPDPDQLPKAPITGGWAAAVQHHFVAAVVPDPSEPTDYALAVKDKEFQLRLAGPVRQASAGGSADFKETLFIGPKLQDQLAATAPELDRTADYGTYLTALARPLFWMLAQVHRIVGNWGFTIIIVTFLIKLCFYPLAQTSGRSMARMRSLAPRMKAIQDRYKDDREQLGKQMMELYKREKVNPLAGCLPIVVQIPVFIAFYWVLLESVEMRQAPFLLWVQDLSTKDPFFVLPAIMGAAMFGQYKLNPAPPDPMQAKVFMFMPLVMTVMMAFFPAGLVLYWITNTGLSIAQQWRINKLVEAEDKKTRS